MLIYSVIFVLRILKIIESYGGAGIPSLFKPRGLRWENEIKMETNFQFKN